MNMETVSGYQAPVGRLAPKTRSELGSGRRARLRAAGVRCRSQREEEAMMTKIERMLVVRSLVVTVSLLGAWSTAYAQAAGGLLGTRTVVASQQSRTFGTTSTTTHTISAWAFTGLHPFYNGVLHATN